MEREGPEIAGDGRKCVGTYASSMAASSGHRHARRWRVASLRDSGLWVPSNVMLTDDRSQKPITTDKVNSNAQTMLNLHLTTHAATRD